MAKIIKRPERVFLEFQGDCYIGDGVVARKGDTIRVPEEKAEQLLRDFPDEWERAGTRHTDPEKTLESPKNKAQKPGRKKQQQESTDPSTGSGQVYAD
jgi:hypothetical protein